MSYGAAKVYFDGSHYIAIPHTERHTKIRPSFGKNDFAIIQEKEVEQDVDDTTEMPSTSLVGSEIPLDEEVVENNEKTAETGKKLVKIRRRMSAKELFNELYSKYIDKPRKMKKELIMRDMSSYFKTEELCEKFVQVNMERMIRNLICRRVRMCRKANLSDFNYFCTFTYDDTKHNEMTFRKKLINALSLLSSRKGWKYIGVWERAPQTKRLHFHGIFYVPDNSMPGKLQEHCDYNFKTKTRTITMQNTYFNDRFGRSDFEEIQNQRELAKEMSYIMKYLEKTGEKIVYSKHLYQYFISDIMDEDVVTTIGQEDTKLLLFDNFKCWDEGVYLGQVSPEVICQMRKCN